MDTKEQVQGTCEPHAWEPQWNLWHRITTALRAFEEMMDADTDPLLRMEVADLNKVLPSLRDPASPVEEEYFEGETLREQAQAIFDYLSADPAEAEKIVPPGRIRLLRDTLTTLKKKESN